MWQSRTVCTHPGTGGTPAASLMCLEGWRDRNYLQSGVSPFTGISLTMEWGGTAAQVRFSGPLRKASAGWTPGGSGWKLLSTRTTAGNTGMAGCSPSHSSLVHQQTQPCSDCVIHSHVWLLQHLPQVEGFTTSLCPWALNGDQITEDFMWGNKNTRFWGFLLQKPYE